MADVPTPPNAEKMRKSFVIGFVFLSGLIACKSNHSDNQSFVKVNGRNIPVVRLDLVNDFATRIPLSTLFESVKIVPLETRKECIVGYCISYMTDRYVFMSVRNHGAPIRLYEFDLTGKFIREFGAVGKGPGEHVGSETGQIIYYPDDSTLFVPFMGADEELHFFNRDGQFIKAIKSPFEEIYQVSRLSDDLFISPGSASSVPVMKRDSSQFVLHRADGTWVKGYPRTIYPANNGSGFIHKGGDDCLWRSSGYWRILSAGNDTVYQITEKSVDPVMLFNFGSKHYRYNQYFPPLTEEGHYYTEILRETDRFLFMKRYCLSKLEIEEPKPGYYWYSFNYNYTLMIYDKMENRGYHVDFSDDLLGILQPALYESYLNWNEFGQPYRIVQVVDVLEWISKAKKDNTLPESAKQRVLELERSIDANSNPVLFLFNPWDEKELAKRLASAEKE